MNKVRDVGEQIAEHLEEIRKLFKPGRCIALVSWSPGYPDRDMVMIEPGHSMQEVVEVVSRRITDPTTQTVHTLSDDPIEGCDCADCQKVRTGR